MKKLTKKNKYNLYHGCVIGLMLGLAITHLTSPHTLLLNFLLSIFLFAPLGSAYYYKKNKPIPRIYWETEDKKRVTIYNSVYDLNKKINGLSRRNDEFSTKPSTVLKMDIAMILTRMPSINYLMNSIDSPSKPMRKLFCKGEFVPKTHALRDCMTDTDYHQVSKILEDMVSRVLQFIFSNYPFKLGFN